MDLGLSGTTDFFSLGTFSAKEIESLLNPTGVRIPTSPSAIQTLLNQGAEYLAQKSPFSLDTLAETYNTFLKTKSDKILSLTPASSNQTTLQNPLICSFDVGSADNGFLAFDWRLSYVLIDALLGGINGVSIEKKQDEPYSVIETNVLRPIFHQLLSLLATDRNIAITPTTMSTVMQTQSKEHTRIFFLIRTPAVSGKLCLEIPSSLIPQEIPEHLLSSAQLAHLPIETQAVIGNLRTTLSDVLNWQIGTELTLGNLEQVAVDLITAHKKVASISLKTDTPNRQVSVEGV